jgi:hypothetical protein
MLIDIARSLCFAFSFVSTLASLALLAEILFSNENEFSHHRFRRICIVSLCINLVYFLEPSLGFHRHHQRHTESSQGNDTR